MSDAKVVSEDLPASASSASDGCFLPSSSTIPSCSWRIFPPPIARTRLIKKKKPKTRSKPQEQHHPEDGGEKKSGNPGKKDQHETKKKEVVNEKRKELWQQKQQKCQYIYPYRVGDPVIILLPQDHRLRPKQPSHKAHAVTSDTGTVTETRKKKMKLTEKEATETTAKNQVSLECNIKNSSCICSNNYFVPFPGKVVKIVSDEEKVNLIHINPEEHFGRDDSDADDAQTITLSLKEQRKRLCPAFSPTTTRPSCSVILIEETLPFRQVIRFQLHNHRQVKDRVLEIGCSTGELSKLVWKNHSEGMLSEAQKETIRGPTWIGMDNSQEMIDRCQKQLNEHKVSLNDNYAAKVVKIDCLEEPKRAFREATSPPDIFGPSPTVVVIDIGGNRECGPVVKIIAWVLETFHNSSLRMVIVKSRALVRQLLSDCEERPTNKIPVSIDAAKGVVSNGTEWFEATHRRLVLDDDTAQNHSQRLQQQRFKHPLKAPMVLSPLDGRTPICRYHNYHKNGCKLYKIDQGRNDGNTKACLLDHDHCHACLQRGHVAKNCPNQHTKQSCY